MAEGDVGSDVSVEKEKKPVGVAVIKQEYVHMKLVVFICIRCKRE